MEIEGTGPATRTAADAPHFGGLRTRSAAMWLLPIAAVVEILITIQTMRSIGLVPPLVVFVVLLAAIAVLALVVPLDPRVFLVGGIVLLLFVATRISRSSSTGSCTRSGRSTHGPTSSRSWRALPALRGFAAFIALRRGAPVVRAMRIRIGEAMLIFVAGANPGHGLSRSSVRCPGDARLGSPTACSRHRRSLRPSWMPSARYSPTRWSSSAPARAPSTWLTPTRFRTRSTSSSAAVFSRTRFPAIRRRGSCWI